MPDGPRLIDVAIAPEPTGVVLVLHGGASRRRAMRVSPAQLSVVRMIPVASEIRRVARRRLAVLRLLNSRRGWDTEHTPLQDVEWALGEVAERFGDSLPVCLVGHSLGGRAALLSANRPSVTGVVALAPWLYADDAAKAGDVTGTRIVVIHGDADRIASPERSRRVARTLRHRTPVSYVEVTDGTHAMLRRRGCFDGLAAGCVAWMLLDEVDDPIIAQLAAGEAETSV